MGVPDPEKHSGASSGADTPTAAGENPAAEAQVRPSAVDAAPVEPPAKAEEQPPAPPDGGVLAWLQVLGSFFLFMNSW